MKAPLLIRRVTEDERSEVPSGLRSSDAFVLRRCQILLALHRGERALVIAKQLGCHKQTVLTVIHGFNTSGLAVLKEGSSGPHRLRTTFSEEGLERLQDLLHRSPRDCSKQWGTWTLELVAQVSFEQGITSMLVSGESVRRALSRLKTNWKRAKHGITIPDQQYLLKKNRDRLIAYASQHPAWAIGFLDEVWWSRFAQPHLSAWQSKEQPVRLIEHTWQKDDPDPRL